MYAIVIGIALGAGRGCRCRVRSEGSTATSCCEAPGASHRTNRPGGLRSSSAPSSARSATTIVLSIPTEVLGQTVPLNGRLVIAAVLVVGLLVVELDGTDGFAPAEQAPGPGRAGPRRQRVRPHVVRLRDGHQRPHLQHHGRAVLVLAAVCLGAPIVVLAAGLGFGLSRGVIPYVPLGATSIHGLRWIALTVAFACAVGLVLINM